MIRRIVVIDEEKCSGCGKCAEACHEMITVTDSETACPPVLRER